MNIAHGVRQPRGLFAQRSDDALRVAGWDEDLHCALVTAAGNDEMALSLPAIGKADLSLAVLPRLPAVPGTQLSYDVTVRNK